MGQSSSVSDDSNRSSIFKIRSAQDLRSKKKKSTASLNDRSYTGSLGSLQTDSSDRPNAAAESAQLQEEPSKSDGNDGSDAECDDDSYNLYSGPECGEPPGVSLDPRFALMAHMLRNLEDLAVLEQRFPGSTLTIEEILEEGSSSAEDAEDSLATGSEASSKAPGCTIEELPPTPPRGAAAEAEPSVADEVSWLKKQLELTRNERDEARRELRAAESRCEAYEAESKSLEEALGSLEAQVKAMVQELKAEVEKKQLLERQLRSTRVRSSPRWSDQSASTVCEPDRASSE